MASGKLRRKIRKKLGMTNTQPAYKKNTVSTQQQVQIVPTKSCCGRGR